MDRKRLVAKILMEKGWAIQSKGFHHFLPIGRPEILAEFFDEWQVDEIVLIEKSSENRLEYLTNAIEKIVEVCRSPLTVCGGITEVNAALNLIKCGADRVAVNSGFVDRPELATDLKDVLGRQAVVGQVDFVYEDGCAWVYDYRNRVKTGLQVNEYCHSLVEAGVGELLLHSVDRDGSKLGYETEVYKDIVKDIEVPVIASGGYGNPTHIDPILETGVQAFTIGNSLSYTEHAATIVKAYARKSEEIRRTHIHYNRSQISDQGRLIKKGDDHLDSLRFKKREAVWM